MAPVAPRFAWVPPRSRSLGRECVDWWKAANGRLFLWQELVIDGMLGLNDDDRWTSANDGLNVARQNGKGVVLQAIEGFAAFELGYPLVVHTAHEFATSLEHQLRLESLIQDAPHLHARVKDKGGYVHANGQESIRLKSSFAMSPSSPAPGVRRDAPRIIFKARTKGSGRGYSGDLLVWDEAMVIPAAIVGAQKPLTRASQAKHGPKTIYAGSAVDQDVHEHGLSFALIRERGIAETPGVSWHEFSAPFDHPSEMTDEVLRDRSWWPLANPSMAEGLISEETMVDEIETMPPRTAAVELGGVGDWPRTDGREEAPIDVALWDDLIDARSKVAKPVFAFDVAPDRSMSAIAAVGARPKGELVHLEVVAHGPGTAWLVPWFRDRVPKHKPIGVACDSFGQAASLVPELQQEGIEVRLLTTGEFAAGCGLLFDAVEQGTVRHLGQRELRDAIRGAVKKKLSDRFKWMPAAGADITPLVAVSVGLEAWWLMRGAYEHPSEPMIAFG